MTIRRIPLQVQRWCFEPHKGFGTADLDGEPMPFGYISTSPTPQPIFELGVILGHDREELRQCAMKMAAAPDLFEAVQQLIEHAQPENWSDDDEGVEHANAWRRAFNAYARASGLREPYALSEVSA